MTVQLTQLQKRKTLCVAGLMSGTSADGIDVAIVQLSGTKVKLLAFDTIVYPPQVRKIILSIAGDQAVSISKISDLHVLIGQLFAGALIQVAKSHRISLKNIDLIGSHGQTVHHNPQGRQVAGHSIRSTLQLGEAAVIAELTGITTVADFRPGDMAAGGQGAPLVAYADYLLLRHPKKHRVVQNIGGIANVTYLSAGKSVNHVQAFDTGPGNMILDQIVSISTRNRCHYDSNGQWAAKGNICKPLLKKLLNHKYYKLKPPKTTGREAFGADYAEKIIAQAKRLQLRRNDLLATVTALTARSIADAYKHFLPRQPDEIFLCGGGAHNQTLVTMLQEYLAPAKVLPIDTTGISADAKEAVSFAILAREAICQTPNNIPRATGARNPVILGKITQACT